MGLLKEVLVFSEENQKCVFADEFLLDRLQNGARTRIFKGGKPEQLRIDEILLSKKIQGKSEFFQVEFIFDEFGHVERLRYIFGIRSTGRAFQFVELVGGHTELLEFGRMSDLDSMFSHSGETGLDSSKQVSTLTRLVNQ